MKALFSNFGYGTKVPLKRWREGGGLIASPHLTCCLLGRY